MLGETIWKNPLRHPNPNPNPNPNPSPNSSPDPSMSILAGSTLIADHLKQEHACQKHTWIVYYRLSTPNQSLIYTEGLTKLDKAY